MALNFGLFFLPDSKFKQQNLAAWQPVFKGSTALPVFFIVGATFIPIGILLIMISNKVKEFSYDYTYCTDAHLGYGTCADFVRNLNNIGKTCYCIITAKLPFFSEPVFVYYGLSNYYQNHRRFVRSRDDDQLYGRDILPSELKSECDPFRTVAVNISEVYGYAPCGVIANSLFNDTFRIIYEDKYNVDLIKTGIALAADKNAKFNSPSSWAHFQKPPNWNKPVWMLDPKDPENNGYKNEDLLVWMRTAALPKFRKLYRRVNHKIDQFIGGLPAGNYTINIEYNYPVTVFNGRKQIIISTTSILGGRNPFLGIAYVVIGTINIVLGGAFLISNFYKKDEGEQSGSTKVKVIKFY